MDLEGYAWFCVFLGKIDGLLHYVALFVCWCQRKTSSYLNSKQRKGWIHLDIILSLSLIHYIALTWCDVCIIQCQSFQHRFFWGPLGRSKMDSQKHKTPKICRSKPLDPRVSPHRSAGFCWRKKHSRCAHGTEVEAGNVTFFNGVNGWDERSDVVWC